MDLATLVAGGIALCAWLRPRREEPPVQKRSVYDKYLQPLERAVLYSVMPTKVCITFEEKVFEFETDLRLEERSLMVAMPIRQHNEILEWMNRIFTELTDISTPVPRGVFNCDSVWLKRKDANPPVGAIHSNHVSVEAVRLFPISVCEVELPTDSVVVIFNFDLYTLSQPKEV